MNAPLLLAFIFAVGALALFAYAFMTGEPGPRSGEKRGIFPADEKGGPVSAKLELQISALEEEIGKLSAEHASLKEQIELARNIEYDLREELTGFKLLKDGWASGLEKIEKQGQIIEQTQERRQGKGPSEDEYNNLKKQLEIQGEVLKKCRDDNEVINSEYSVLKKQLQEKEVALSKLSQSQDIAPEEYNRLKVKLAQAEEVLRIIHAAG